MLKAPGPSVQAKADTSTCRCCGHTGLHAILDYGDMPASDRFLRPTETAITHPLELAYCQQCGLLQLLDAPPASELFGTDYLYQSSCSDSWLEHARNNAAALIERLALGVNDRVIELASNDGYLLQYFQQQGITALGIDPAPVPAAVARERGIETREVFFNREVAARMRAEGITARLVIANNVLAHVEDPLDFAAGVREILEPGGHWVIEVPHAMALVEGTAFDTVYHEHRCYFSLHALSALLEQQGFRIVDVEPLKSHGGSLRVYASLQGAPTAAVSEWLAAEQSAGVTTAGYFEAFAASALATREAIAEALDTLAAQGKRIAAYGAAAKGTVLLNCLGSAGAHLQFVVDRNRSKHGRRVPGVGLPIESIDYLEGNNIDYLLLLPWNLEREILAQQADFCRDGGRFIVPLPQPRIAGAQYA